MSRSSTSDCLDHLIDSVLEGMEVPGPKIEEAPKRFPINHHLPLEYQAKYQRLQEVTRGKFGKLMKEMVRRSIDHATDKLKKAS